MSNCKRVIIYNIKNSDIYTFTTIKRDISDYGMSLIFFQNRKAFSHSHLYFSTLAIRLMHKITCTIQVVRILY